MFDAIEFEHTASVSRLSRSITAAQDAVEGFEVVYPELQCTISSFDPWRQATILGDISRYRYKVAWGEEQLQEDDVFTFNSRRYELKIDMDDTLRINTMIPPYQTGFLSEELLESRY